MLINRPLVILLFALAMAVPGMAQRVQFTSGIGYYVFYDGYARLLGFTTRLSEKFEDSSVMRIPKHAEFYTYGLDLSHIFGVTGDPGSMQIVPLPPHLAGIGMFYLTKDGKIDGRYMVHFTPVPGYPEKVYRISIPYLYFLAQGTKPYDYFALRLLPGDGEHGRGYLFRFTDDEPQAKRLVDGLAGKLASGVALEGELYAERFGLGGGPPSETMKVVLQIDGFDAKAGTFNATLKLPADAKIAFKGSKVSERELVLTRADDANTQLHLFLRGDGMLAGSWQQFGLLGFTSASVSFKIDLPAAK